MAWRMVDTSGFFDGGSVYEEYKTHSIGGRVLSEVLLPFKSMPD
jgi:hypothetical protein